MGAVVLGLIGLTRVGPGLLPFIVVGPVLVVGYNLELFGGRLHTDVAFALAWGTFPVLTGYFAQAERIDLVALLGGVSCVRALVRAALPEHTGASCASPGDASRGHTRDRRRDRARAERPNAPRAAGASAPRAVVEHGDARDRARGGPAPLVAPLAEPREVGCGRRRRSTRPPGRGPTEACRGARRAATRIGRCIISMVQVTSARVPSPSGSRTSWARPSRSPWTAASMRRGRTHSRSATRTPMRYGTGGTTTPRSTVPACSPGPSTRNSFSQLHHVSKRSRCSIPDQTSSGGIGKLNAPPYSIAYGELATGSGYADDGERRQR